jgi:hypothetical protein
MRGGRDSRFKELGQAQTLKIKKMLSFGEIMKMKNMLSFWSGLGRHAGRERLQI